MIIIGIVLWYLIGLYSFYYWWRKDCDIDTDPKLLKLWFITGFLGIITWFIGRRIHHEGKEEDYKVLFKKSK